MKEQFRIKPFTNASGTRSYRVAGMLNGQRKRGNFKTEGEALVQKQNWECEAMNVAPPAVVATRLTPEQCAEAEGCFQLLKESPLSLTRAVKYALDNYTPADKTITVRAALPLFIQDKKNSLQHGLAEATEKKLKERLAGLVKKHGDTQINEIMPQHIEALVFREGSGAVNRHSDRANLMNFFNWAVFRKYCKTNPVKETLKIELDFGEPVVLSLAECRSVVEKAQVHECRTFKQDKIVVERGSLVPFVVLALFCGLRVKEIARLQKFGGWDNIDFDAKTITLGPKIAKGRSRRVVDIPDAAMAFLPTLALQNKTFVTPNLRRRLAEVRKLAGLGEWVPDAFRHTAISYHLAKCGNEDTTATWAGNSPTVIHKHYRGKVKQADVAQFWAIRPGITEIITLKTKAA